MRRSARFLASLSLVFAATFVLHAQAPGGRADGQDARAARAYQEAVKAGPLALRAFLVGFPKGADLHVHLSGAVYAESFIRAAGEDGLCVDATALSFAKPPCDSPAIPASRLQWQPQPCRPGTLRPAGRRFLNAQLCAYGRIQRARPVFCYFRSLWRAEQAAYGRVGG